MENEELIRRATDLHEETQETEKQISIIDEQIRELENYKSHVNSLKNVSDQNVLSSIGKGIHVKTRFESPEIFIEVGAGVVSRKQLKRLSRYMKNSSLNSNSGVFNSCSVFKH
jgi:prefoldin subunit 5